MVRVAFLLLCLPACVTGCLARWCLSPELKSYPALLSSSLQYSAYRTLTSAMHCVNTQTNRAASFTSTHRNWMSAPVSNLLCLDGSHLELPVKAKAVGDARQHWRSWRFLSCTTPACKAEHYLTFPWPSLPTCKICMIKERCLEINGYW